jgi:hypothetical protein
MPIREIGLENLPNLNVQLPGDWVTFGIDTVRDRTLTPSQQEKGDGDMVTVQLGYLRSYEHMGIGIIR